MIGFGPMVLMLISVFGIGVAVGGLIERWRQMDVTGKERK